METFNSIVQNGVFYNPANKHYDYKGYVVCIRYKNTNLKVCIGYKSYDMCLSCVQEVVDFDTLSEDLDITLMMQDQFSFFDDY